MISDWDPSKWIIYLLHHYTPLVPTIASTPSSSILKAQAAVLRAEADRLLQSLPAHHRATPIDELPIWTANEAMKQHGGCAVDLVGEDEWMRRRRVLILIDDAFIDVGGYLEEHVSLVLSPSIGFDPVLI